MAEVELQQIGPYSITELLRASSTSNFYRGKQRKKDFLIQRLTIALPTNEEKEAFLARARQLKKLKNRDIVGVLDANFDGDYGYLALEYIMGETLRQHIAPGAKLAPDKVKRMLSPVASALHYAHLSNITHSNLHPGNLLLKERNDTSPLLTEFSLTSPGFTPSLDDEEFAIPYMAPEQLRDQASAASDQYALAVMAYEWLCGCRPYEATDREQLQQQQQQAPFPAPSSLNSAISPAVERVIVQALAFDPAERFPHIQAFADHYLSALMGFPVKTPVPTVISSTHKSAQTSPVPSLKPAANDVTREDTQIQLDASPLTPVVPASADIPKTPQLPAITHAPLTTPTPHVVPPVSQAPLPLSTQASGHALTDDTPLVSHSQDDDDTLTAEAPLRTTIVDDLCQGGILSQSLPGYEERPAQIEMASMVARAITQGVPAIIEAGTGTGKALDVDTPIPTPSGWKCMGDLVVGDMVFDEKGHPTRIVAAFDIMHQRPCYEVMFSDGSSLVADAEHEWASYTATDRKHKRVNQAKTSTYIDKNFVTLDQMITLDQLIALSHNDDTLSISEAVALIGGHRWSIYQAMREIATVNSSKRPAHYPRHTLLTTTRSRLARDLSEQRRDNRAYTLVTTEQMAATLTVGASKRTNHAIAVAGSLTLPDADLPIAPYFLGVWLGDGGERSNQITSADPDIIAEIEKDGYTVRSLSSHQYLYAVDDENGKAVSRWQPGMTGRLRTLGVWRNKHIPTLYLRASEQQRRALLAGLLDTDGTVSHTGAIEFTNTNPQLAQDMYELVCSLGFRPTLRQGRAQYNGKDCGPKWIIAFTTKKQVFRLERKITAHKERLRNYSPERNYFRYVVEVREVPSRPVRCIQVESESHLYLAGKSMIPTHNSLAYIVPIARSGKVAIVSTANKALQEQLFYKDIPFVQKYIKRFEAALVKGVSNYVCMDRVEGERTGMQFFTKNRDFNRLLNVINDPDSTFTGDFETLGFQLPSDIRSRVATDSDQCAWSKCNFFSECYVRQMRERAERAQIIVVNHTLLLLDAALDGFLLPERDLIVLERGPSPGGRSHALFYNHCRTCSDTNAAGTAYAQGS